MLAVLDFNGTGVGDITVDFTAMTVSEAGGASMSFVDIDTVNIDAAGRAILFDGSAADEAFSVTPGLAAAGVTTVRLDGLNTVFNTQDESTLTIDGNGGSDSVLVFGTNGVDSILASPSSVTVIGRQTIDLAAVELLTVDALADNDSFIVIAGAGSVTSMQLLGGLGDDGFVASPMAGVHLIIDGGLPGAAAPGVPGDRVQLVAPGDARYTLGANPGDAVIDGTGFNDVDLRGIESFVLNSTGGGSLTIEGTNNDDAIAVAPNLFPSLFPHDGQITVNEGAAFDFEGFSELTLSGRSGADSFDVTPITGVAIFVEGDASNADRMVVRGTAGVDTVGYAPLTADSGSFIVNGLPAINFKTVEVVEYNGQGGDDNITITTPAELHEVRVLPGVQATQGEVVIRAPLVGQIAGLVLTDVNPSGSLTIQDAGGARSDDLVVNGRPIANAGEVFNVSPTGQITITESPVVGSALLFPAINTPGIRNLTLAGLDGDDAFNISAPQAFQNILIDGGEPSASDVVNLIGDGTAIAVTTTQVSGGGLGVVSLLGVEEVNIAANGGAVAVNGAVSNTKIEVTNLSATGGRVLNEDAPVINFTGASSFAINTFGASDELIVSATQHGDSIAVTPGSVSIAGVIPVNFTGVETLTVDGLAGNDAFTIIAGAGSTTTMRLVGGLGDDLFTGSPLAGVNIVVEGDAPGAGSDALNIIVPGNARILQGPNADEGVIDMTGLGDIDFSGIENIGIVSTDNGTLTVQGTNDDDTFSAFNFDGQNLVRVNAGPAIGFGGFSALTLAGQAGSDDFFVSPILGVAIAVGGDASTNDRLVVSGTSGADTVAYNPTTATAGSFTINAAPTIQFSGIEEVEYDGQGGNDNITITTPAGLHEVHVLPGVTSTEGAVVMQAPASGVGDIADLKYKNVNGNSQLTIVDAGGGRGDDLTVSGRPIANASDVFNVDSTGQISLSEPLALGGAFLLLRINTPGIRHLTLSGLAGDDVFTITAPQAFQNILIDGGEPSASDVVNLIGDGTAIAVSPTQVAGGGLGVVSLLGVETVNIDANGGNIDYLATTDDDTVVVSNLGANSGRIETNGEAPVINFDEAGVVTLDLLAGSDQLIVKATQGDDTIAVSTAAVTVGALETINFVNAETLAVEGLDGDDTFNVTPGAIPIFIDGGNPIGETAGDTIVPIAMGNPVVIEAGPENDEGSFIVGAFERISFDHIEAISIVGPGPVVLTGTNGDDDITIIARDASTHVGADGIQDFTVSVNDGPEILFIDTPVFYVDALSGDDDIVVRTPAPNQAEWDVDLFIAGGAPSDGEPGDGDRFVLETPGADTVIYTPTGSDTGTFLIDEAVNDSLITISPFTLVIGPFVYISSPGGVELVEYDGEGGDDTLTIVGTAGDDTIVHTPGTGRDEGVVRVGESLGISYQNLGLGAVLNVDGAGANDTLIVDGTLISDTFGVTGASITLNNRIPITTLNLENLRLNGITGDDIFNLNALLPFATILVDAGEPSASDVLNLTGTAGLEAIVVDLDDQSVTGFGGVVSYLGVETLNLNGVAGGDTLTINGGPDDDVITYTPTGAESGNVRRDGDNTLVSFGAFGGTFSINGGEDSGDLVIVQGTNNHDVITVNMGARTASVENAVGVVLKPVTLGDSVEELSVLGRLGNDTFHVIPAPATAFTVDGFPRNLLVNVDGGAEGSGDALVIADVGGARLGANLFAAVNRSRQANQGVVRIFESQGAGLEPLQYPDIIYDDVEVVSPRMFINPGTLGSNLLILGPDEYEPNEFVLNSAFIGSGSTHNIVNLAIFPNAFEHRFVEADQDFFRVIATHTGTLDFQVYFTQFDGFLPGAGDLQIEVRDENGVVITNFGVNDFTPNDERRRIPVVAGETYYLHVFGALPTTVNGYNVSIINTPAPVPYDLELDDTFPGPNSDTGRSQFDNITMDNTPTIFIRLDDSVLLNDLTGGGPGGLPPDGQVIPIPFRGSAEAGLPGYRIAIFDEVNTQNPVLLGFADQVPGQPGVYTFTFTAPLTDGSHFITAKVQMVDPSGDLDTAFGGVSQSLEIIVDTVAPNVTFGEPSIVDDGLAPQSDSGVPAQPDTFQDRITNDTTPTLYGRAEANSIVRVYADLNNNGVIDAGDLFLAQTVADPLDGSNQFPNGSWTVDVTVDLNDPAYFPQDGVRRLLVEAEDVAGNISTPDSLIIFIDTQGPVVDDVVIPGFPGFDIFANKGGNPPTMMPTPLITSLDIVFTDDPIRVDLGGGNVFVYPAVNEILAETVGNYTLIGDATGFVVITSAELIDSTVAGDIGRSIVRLTFAEPLPDDRFTLIISDAITDDPGNRLDGDPEPNSPFGGGGIVFPSGDGTPGGSFSGRFTVDTRPELAVFSAGTISIDINGNFYYDPNNVDATNRDLTFKLGFDSDYLFNGNFNSAFGGPANGFDKLGAYGFVNGAWRWLIDTNGDGVIRTADGDIDVINPLQIDALPFSGNFNGNAADGDEVGLFDGVTWYFDTNGDNVIDALDLTITGTMRGYPIIGDFDGDGLWDMATWSNDRFFFDLAANGRTGNADATIDFGFSGVLERPVAADMDADGIDDVGLWVPARSEQLPGTISQWYFLVSDDMAGTKRVPGTVNTLDHDFSPDPFTADIFAQFGDEFALPLVGNFDPPIGASQASDLVNRLYQEILNRTPGANEFDFWSNAIQKGGSYLDIAAGFITSREYRSNVINKLYQDYLGRDVDNAGLEHWLKVWQATGGPEYIQAGIIGSEEYFQFAGGTPEDWVRALYNNLLGRTSIKQEEIDFWVESLETITKEEIVLGFVTSDEYRLDLIRGWYLNYLGREIDDSGAQFWVQQMKNGLSQTAIQIGLVGSAEYRNRK